MARPRRAFAAPVLGRSDAVPGRPAASGPLRGLVLHSTDSICLHSPLSNQVTLETTCKENNAGYEWGGAFATPANAYKWVAQAVEDGYAVGGPTLKYADATMKLVIFDSHQADSEHLLEFAMTAKTLMAGTCNTVNTAGAILKPTAAGACYTLTFPTDPNTDFHATINTMGVDNVAFFTEHAPTEFERDTHYLMSDGMTPQQMIDTTDGGTLTGASAGLGPVEPGAETDAEEYNCKFLKDSSQVVKVCAQAFLIIQAHHDYCPHDTLTRYEEELFHEWEGKCYGCEIVRKYDPSLKKCPVIDCTDTTVAQLGYGHLNETCTPADTEFAFEWASMVKVPLWQAPSSAPAPPQGAPGGSGWRARPGGEVSPPGAQPLPLVLELAASKVADFTAFDHPGGRPPSTRPPTATRGSRRRMKTTIPRQAARNTRTTP